MTIFPSFRGYLNNPGFSYLLSEDFEGVGIPPGWVYGSGPNSSGDFDFSTAGLNLQGSQCFRAEYGQSGVAGWFTTTVTGFNNLSSTEIYFKFRLSRYPSVTQSWFYILSEDLTECLRIRIGTAGVVDIRCLSGTNDGMASSISTGVTYNMWLRWEQGTSGSPFASVAISTSNARPVSGDSYYVQKNVGSSDNTFSKMRFGLGNSLLAEYYVDKIRVTDGRSIPDNPI